MSLRDSILANHKGYQASLSKANTVEKKNDPILPVADQKALSKSFSIKTLALGYEGLPGDLSSRSVFEASPYDFDRIMQAIDTDSYLKQGFAKYKELFWKEGWDIVGENDEAVAYLWQRVDFLEVAMRRPFNEFLADVADQLIKFSNVFIAKYRSDDIKEFFPGKLYTDTKPPIVGYYILPTERIEIMRDRHNRPKWYRQRIDESMVGSRNNRQEPIWNANDVIHLAWDKKIGRAFGTPFIEAALDDIVALRQIEEDIQNLIHRELFPLYKYMVGTDEHPASQEEIDAAVSEIESLRSEGGLVLPHRHDVDVIGADGNVLEAEGYLTHFKERAAVGVGLYPHHLGMTADGGNKAMTDRLDIAVYDKVKTYQRFFADAMEYYVFRELLLEGGFDPMENPMAEGISDRCIFTFNEIDVDTQVKKETHEMQKVANGIATIPEGRLSLKMSPDMDESQTFHAMQARMSPDTVTQTKTADGKPGAPKLVDTTPSAAKADTNPSSKGGKPNLRNTKRGGGNIIRPANQHGRRRSPNIRHFDLDDDWLNEVESLLGDDVQLNED